MLYIGKIHHALASGEYNVIGELCEKEFGLRLQADELAEIVSSADTETNSRSGGWSDESWRAWIKRRVDHHFTAGCDSYNSTPWVSATMHVFFIHLEETEEMLLLLRKYNDLGPEQAVVAFSKIFDDAGRIPTPIDRTAKRVARPPTK